MSTNEINIFTDGGSRGNPGQAAIGVYIEDLNGKTLALIGKRLGIATNNVAEYKAVLEALDWVISSGEQYVKINFYLDSNLVMSQLNGLFKIKNAALRELLFSAKQKETTIKSPITYKYIPREQNKKADSLVNQALDYLI